MGVLQTQQYNPFQVAQITPKNYITIGSDIAQNENYLLTCAYTKEQDEIVAVLYKKEENATLFSIAADGTISQDNILNQTSDWIYLSHDHKIFTADKKSGQITLYLPDNN